MPHQVVTESNASGVVITLSGVVSGAEVIDLNDRLVSEEGYLRCRYQVWDFSRATRLDLTIEDLRSISVRDIAASAINPNVKIAIVGEQTLFLGRDRIFQILEEAWTAYRPRFFVDAETAREWASTDQPQTMQTVYQALGGDEGLLRLASAWHTRVLEDAVVSHAFSHGFHPQHTERLAAYWAEALGGPTTYSDRYGNETSVVRMHSGNGPHEDMDQRAIACFDRALEDIGLARDEPLGRVLHDYFEWATTTTMARYHHSADDVPDGLQIPKWSWQGLVAA